MYRSIRSSPSSSSDDDKKIEALLEFWAKITLYGPLQPVDSSRWISKGAPASMLNPKFTNRDTGKIRKIEMWQMNFKDGKVWYKKSIA